MALLSDINVGSVNPPRWPAGGTGHHLGQSTPYHQFRWLADLAGLSTEKLGRQCHFFSTVASLR
jgi:hypothetical protein